ncbi:MAG: GNAT family N-acetyltransferase [Chloroflexi bacterium]|nr:GNAT family N-acetyltransferase [Chloroflexota bacterium]
MSETQKPIETITVRAATPSDYEICAQIDHGCSTETVWQMIVDNSEAEQQIVFRPARLPRSMKVLYPRSDEALIQSWQLHSLFLVATVEDEVVGYINVREELPQETAWVADLAVDGPARLQGIGSQLIRAARKWAYERGLRRLIFETQTKNYPAIQFLQKRGLVFCGYNDLYYPNQDIAVFFGQTLR